ncbi:MAG: J domain-containing protein [Flavipsychrobacter sp.]|nr:J domain-containing protein [Flavipsychrobacter sp.]
MKDHYFILGVASSAGSHEIKEAFRKLSLKYHPDRTRPTPFNQERYMEICEAYRVLSSKNKRAEYDRKRTSAAKDLSVGSGLFPEIKTSYKGHYPWLAAFAVVLVAGLALLFANANREVYPEPVRVAPVATASVLPPSASAPVAPQAMADTMQADTATPEPAPTEINMDSLKRHQELALKITSALSNATTSAPPQSAEDRNHSYTLDGNKLLVRFKTGARGQASSRLASIPLTEVNSVYYYAGKLWITTGRKSIRSRDIKTGMQTRNNFFCIPMKASGAAASEKALTEVIAELKKG